MSDRQGDWMQTFTGRKFWPFDPRPEDVCIEDIAHALSLICRFGGHTKSHYCPAMDHRILTSDLKWVPAGDLSVGRGLVAFDEMPHELGSAGNRRRRNRYATVKHFEPIKRPMVRLELSNGSVLRCSEEHPWLISTKQSRNQVWRTAKEISSDLSLKRARYMQQFIPPWDTLQTRDAGWLAGMYDGEGYFSSKNRKGTQLGLSQRIGPTLERMKSMLTMLGFKFKGSPKSSENDVITLQMLGGITEAMRLLGSVRPHRLLETWEKFLINGDVCKQVGGNQLIQILKAEVEPKEDWCAGIETSTHTYYCEGFCAHNSVAQHSVYVMNLAKREFKASPEVQLHALLHDAAEAYIGDMVNPIKKEMTSFRHLDIGVTACIYERFGLTPHSDSHSVVDKCDKILVSTEAKSPLILAQPPIDDWHLKIAEPLDGELTPWLADKAETVFLAEFRELYKGE